MPNPKPNPKPNPNPDPSWCLIGAHLVALPYPQSPLAVPTAHQALPDPEPMGPVHFRTTSLTHRGQRLAIAAGLLAQTHGGGGGMVTDSG